MLFTFSWDMATCVSSSLIKALADHQPQLESPSLTTDVLCLVSDSRKNSLVDLERFQKLKMISCNGIQRHNRKALRRAISNNSRHLQTLEIDTQEVFSAQRLYPRTTIPPWQNSCEAMVTQFLDSRSCFPALHNLRLERMAFTDACIDALKGQFNFGLLESCSIVQCGEDMDLVETIGCYLPRDHTNLKRLEIGAAHLQEAEGVVGQLLRSMNGLVDLFVSVNAKQRYTEITHFWRALQNHRSTLKRLVYQRNVAFSDEASWNGYEDPSLGLEDPATDLLLMQHPLTNFNLECLGLSCDLQQLVSKPIIHLACFCSGI